MDIYDRSVAIGMLFGIGQSLDWPDEVSCTKTSSLITITETWDEKPDVDPHDDLIYKVTLTQEHTDPQDETSPTITTVTRVTLPDNSYVSMEGFYPDNFLYMAVSNS